MKDTIVNGRAIQHYKDFDERSTGYYLNEDPAYKPTISNGYNPHDFPIDGLVLYLPLGGLKGSSFKSVDAYKHTCGVTGALWNPDGRLFDGDDLIDCGSGASLDDLTEFTQIMWINPDTGYGVSGSPRLFDKSSDSTISTQSWIASASGKVQVNVDFDGAANATSLSTDIVTENAWSLLFLELSSADNKIRIYIGSGGTVSEVAYDTQTAGIGALVADATYPLILGNREDAARGLDGETGGVWVYNRLFSATEKTHLYKTTEWRYS